MSTDNLLAPIAALTLPDSGAMTERARGALAFIESFQIATPEDYGLAADELKAIKTKANKLEEQRTSLTGPLNKVLKGINDLFRGPADLLGSAERILKGKMLAWDQEQERIVAEARRKAEEAARVERLRIEAEAAERQRVANEAAAAAAAAAAKGDESAAQAAQDQAQRAQAEATTLSLTSAMVVAAPVVAIEKPAAKGISTSKKVDFEVTDLHALVKHIGERPELLALLKADEVKLRAYVRGLGMSCALPGVRVFEERVMSARAA